MIRALLTRRERAEIARLTAALHDAEIERIDRAQAKGKP